MDGTNMSASDVALLSKNNGWGDNSVLWFVLLLFMMGGMGAWGGRGPAQPSNLVTQSELTNGLNNQQTQAQLSQLSLSSANNNYETLQNLTQQNYTNQTNMIQGFNQLNQNITGQTYQLSSKLDSLGAQMQQCCGSIQTLIQQNKYEALQRDYEKAQDELTAMRQSQYMLGQFGRYVAYAGDGSKVAAAA